MCLSGNQSEKRWNRVSQDNPKRGGDAREKMEANLYRALKRGIEFALSSQGLMWNEDSSTLPEQGEGGGIKIRLSRQGNRSL